MKLTSESKFFIGIIVATVAIIGIAAFFLSKPTSTSTPSIPSEQLIGQNSHTRGNASASAVLVEFSDFQCPACKAAKPIVDQVIEENKDKLLFVYRHFPLDQHQFAIDAALAAEAAGGQGKFWEMYDLLFANQEKFTKDIFIELARQLKLDETKFTQAVNDPGLKTKIMADRDFGITVGINSTPTFFLNGKKLELTSFNDIKTQVEREVQ